MQQLQVLASQQGEHGSDARDVAGRPMDARYQTRRDRVASAQEDDGNALRCSRRFSLMKMQPIYHNDQSVLSYRLLFWSMRYGPRRPEVF